MNINQFYTLAAIKHLYDFQLLLLLSCSNILQEKNNISQHKTHANVTKEKQFGSCA